MSQSPKKNSDIIASLLDSSFANVAVSLGYFFGIFYTCIRQAHPNTTLFIFYTDFKVVIVQLRAYHVLEDVYRWKLVI